MKALENFGIYTFGSILQTAIGFLLLPIYIRYLTPVEYGVISVILVMSSILIVFTNLGAASGFYRLYYEGPKEKLFTTTLIWRLLTASLAFILVASFSRGISLVLFKVERYQLAVLYAGLFIFVSPLRELFFLTLRLKQLAKKFVAYSLFYAIVNFTLKFIYVALLKKGVNGYWIAQIITEFLSVGVIFLHAKMSSMFKKPTFSLLKQILKIGFPYTFSTLGAWIVDSSDKLLLNFFIGPGIVGIYTLAIRISSLFRIILNTPVGLWWGPFALERASNEGVEQFKNTDKKFLNVASTSGFLAVPIISLLGLIVAVLPGHPEYKNAILLVPFCLIPPLLYLIMHPFSIQFIQAKKTQYAGWGGVTAAGVNLGINFLLIPVIGVWGAIISSIVAYFSWLIIYYIGGQKSLYIHYEWGRVTKSFSVFLSYELILIMIFLLKKNFCIPALIIGSIVAIVVLVIYNYKLLALFTVESKTIIETYASKAIAVLKR